MIENLFSLSGKVAIVTGGTGALGGEIARGFAAAGARVGVLGRRTDKAEAVVHAIVTSGGESQALTADVLIKAELEAACEQVLATWGRIDVLVNAAGGNMPQATVHDNQTFFDISQEALEQVIALNLTGTILPCQVFGVVMARQGEGSIINISSMAAQKPLSRVVGYGSAKAAIDNFTQWLSIEFARKYSPRLRVNAIAPGFFISEQNHELLLNKDGSYSERGQLIINHTPMGRFGEPDELIGTAVWLAGRGSKFVTGAVIPVDGGFMAWSGI